VKESQKLKQCMIAALKGISIYKTNSRPVFALNFFTDMSRIINHSETGHFDGHLICC